MPLGVNIVQGCDARDDDSSTEAGTKKRGRKKQPPLKFNYFSCKKGYL